jgi:general secretion pathway protein K
MNSPPQRQRGVALLVALLVVALAVILIAALLDRGELALARTRNALRSEQAEAYAQGLEIYAAQVLISTAGQGPDTNASPWAVPLPPQPVPGGMISATMRDMNGCFNLNNLAPSSQGGDPAWEPMFERLLTVRGIDPTLAKTVQSWLDAQAHSAEDNYYLAQVIPYRAAHRGFAHVSELRLVRGFSGDVYARLAPYVCALPSGTMVNVNTASVPVLQALGSPALSQAQGEQLWQNGQAKGEGALSDLKTHWQQQGIAIDSALTDRMVGTTSTYFLARGDVLLDDVPFTFFSLIQSGLGIQVIERSRGSDDALIAPAPVDADRPHDGD